MKVTSSMLPFAFSQHCASTVEYKLFFTAPNEEEEIRCLLLNGIYRFDYIFLKRKISEIFPILKNHDFDLHWKDEEGDKIKIATDDDLKVLVSRGVSRVKKLYVTLKEQKGNIGNSVSELTDNSKSSKPSVHVGVTCDVCLQNPLQGYRYKCLICPDFDICMNCEKTEKVHTHHPVVRFPMPLTNEIFFSSEYESVRNNINGILQMYT